MKNNLLKLTALAMAAILIFMSLSACKKKSEKEPSKVTSSQSSENEENNSGGDNSNANSENDTVSTPSFNISDINWDDGPTYDDGTDYVPVFYVEDMLDGDTETY